MSLLLNELNQQTVLNNQILNASFELTPNCNFNCRMCYIHRPECYKQNTQLKPISFWKSMAEQAKDMGILALVITGGETFLYPEIDELLEYLMRMGFLISLNTNGVLLDDNRMKWLKRYRPTKINISLYGGTDQTYEKLCGCSNGFTRVSDTIDNLLADGQNVYINSVIVPENADDIPKMVEFAKKRGLIIHGTTYIFPPGRYGIHEAPTRLSPRDAAQAYMLLEYLQYGEQYQIENSIQKFKLVCIEQQKNKMLEDVYEINRCGQNNCTGGKNSFAITWDGKMLPCTQNAGIEVDLETTSLLSAWDILKEKVGQLVLPTECSKCQYQKICNACPASIYNETGGFTSLTPYICDFTRAQFDERVQLLLKKCILRR